MLFARDKKLSLAISPNNTSNILASGTTDLSTLTEAGWIHVAGTFDGATARVYVNGVQEGSTPTTTGIADNDIPFRIGSYLLQGAGHFDGLIDEVSVFDYALTEAEIKALYDSSGNSSTGSFTVEVVDTTPPTLNLPTLVALEAAGAEGTAHSYEVAATDVVDPNPGVACDPRSGNTFPLGITTVNCTATDFSGNSDTDSFTVTVYVDETAVAEIFVSGLVSGSYVDTKNGGGVSEAITERESGGKRHDRYSYLEHKWVFNVMGGEEVTFFLNAWGSVSGDGDRYEFSYSHDDVNYMDMLKVTKTADDQSFQSFAMGRSPDETIYIRVIDTDRTKGNRSLDTIYVDHMFIRSVPSVDGGTPNTMYLESMALSFSTKGKNIQAEAQITVMDQNGAPVPGAIVTVDWFLNDTRFDTGDSGTTGNQGVANITSKNVKGVNSDVIKFCVTDVAHAYTYIQPANACAEVLV